MSIASSIPSMKLKLSPSPPPSHHHPKFSVTTIIRCSNAEGPLRRPAAPSLSPPPPPPSPSPPLSPPPSLSPTPPAKSVSSAPPKPVEAVAAKAVVTLEFQRRMAKELQDYYKQKKLEDADKGPFFGFLGKNEVTNGRWAMFGFAVGLLTEYATGADFVQQLKILLSNFGIVDLE